MSNTKLVKRFLSNLLTWPVYLLSCVVPRSKKIWVFGSYPGTFLDNSKYLFLKFYQRDSPYGDIKAIWITKSKALAREMRANGYRCYLKFSIKGIYYCLRASVFVYSWTVREINFWLSGRAVLVNLWHGLPLKKIGLDIKQKEKGTSESIKKSINFYLYPTRYLKSDYFLSTRSPEISNIFKHAYQSKQLIHALYPRVEHFLLDEEARTAFIDGIATHEERQLLQYMKRYKYVWVYMPTFRDDKDDEKKMHEKSVFDYARINAVLEKCDVLLLIKFHVSLFKKNSGQTFSNILFLNGKMDMYTILPQTSGLITDYSSVFFDYMLLSKPMLFYNFDIEAYTKNSRQFYFNYDEVACGPVIANFGDLCNWFEQGCFLQNTPSYEAHVQRFWGCLHKPTLVEQLYEKIENPKSKNGILMS